jgi:hypothetical protein
MYLDKEVSIELDPEVHVTHSVALARKYRIKHEDVLAMARKLLHTEELDKFLPVLQVDGRTAYGVTRYMAEHMQYLFKP